MTELSLFQGDPFRRLLTSLRLAQDGRIRYGRLVPLLVILNWFVPLGLCAWRGTLVATNAVPLSFLRDPERPIQTLVILVFLLAEVLVDEHVRNAGRIFSSSGILEDPSEYDRAADATRRLRTKVWPEVVIVLLACAATSLWVRADLQAGSVTWKVSRTASSFVLSPAGWWLAVVVSQIHGFFWIRWAWKIAIWVAFLARMARAKLRLAVGHPDEVAGLGFIGETQATFGLVIFGVGLLVSLEAVKWFWPITAGLGERGLTFSNLLTEVACFVVLAPLAFLLPLLMFTKTLYLAKQDGLAKYQILLTEYINEFEKTHFREDRRAAEPLAATATDLAALANIEGLHAHLMRMRIVPFDMGSMVHLAMYAAGPFVVIIVKRVAHWPPWFLEYLEHITK